MFIVFSSFVSWLLFLSGLSNEHESRPASLVFHRVW